MKNILILALLLVFGKTAEANMVMSSFKLKGASSDNKITVNDSQVSTNIEFNFNLMKYSDPSSPGDCYVTLLYTESPENNNFDSHPSTIEISPTKYVRKSEFASNGTIYQSDWLPAVLPAYKFSGKIVIRYRFFHSAQNKEVSWYSTVKYEINAPNYISQNEISKIQSMGFSTNGIQIFNNDYYLVDGDVLIKKDGLSNSNYNSYVINGNNDHNVNILIDNSIWANYTWYGALHDALKVWNSVPNSNIKINLISSPDGYYGSTPRTDIVLKGDNGVLPAGVATYAAYPKGDGNPGDLILVNSDFTQNPQQSTWNMIHAIGHALGLKHAVNNSSSIMNKGNFLNSYPSSLNFALPTSYDINTLISLYSLNLNSAIQPYIHGNNVVFSLSYSSVESGINYSWKIEGINGTNYIYEESGAAGVSDLYLSSGNYRVQCIISNGKYSNPVTVSKNITL